MTPSFTIQDLWALSPYLTLLLGALLILLIETFLPKFAAKISHFLAAASFFASFLCTLSAPPLSNTILTRWIVIDPFAVLALQLFLLIGFFSTWIARAFFKRFPATQGEFYFLLSIAVLGLMLIAASADFLILFLGIETLSIPLYVLCCYQKGWNHSREAALKYFLLGSIGSALLLYGIALLYGAMGTTQFSALQPTFANLTEGSKITLFWAGIALVTLGLSFKAALVPFHLWAPDVYDGSPTPVTAFMSVGTKAGAFIAFSRIFLFSLPSFSFIWSDALLWIACATLIYANFVALKQHQLRRFFAYSGISHSGLMVIAVASGGPEAATALYFYLCVYAIATLSAFYVLATLETSSEGLLFIDLKGLFSREPVSALLLALSFLTLAGIPPTAGFLAKLFLFKVALQAGNVFIVILALFASVLAAYYYIRGVVLLFQTASEEEGSFAVSSPVIYAGLALLTLIAVYPEPLISRVQQLLN